MHVYPHYSFHLAHVSNIWVNGTAGSGYIRFKSQTTDPATPEAGQVVIYSDSTVSNIARMSMLTSSGAVLVFFRDQVDTVRNASGSAMTKGQVVYKNGANGTTATVELAKADAALTSGAVGLILAPTLANNSFGTIITKGTFRGIDTTAFTQGDALYVSPTVAGELTNVRPVSPNYDVKIGTVITSSANGIVDLTPQPYVPTPFEDMNRVLGQRTLVKGPAAAHAIGPISILGQVTTVTSQTGTGSKFVMDTSPTLVTPNIGTPSAGVVTNLTGTASININGTVGATTPTTGAFTTLTASGDITGSAVSSRFALGTTTLGRVAARVAPTFTDSATAVYGLTLGSTVSNSNTEYNGSHFSLSVSTGATITSAYGVRVLDPTGVGAITTNYGLHLASQTKGATNYAIYSAGGQSVHAGNFRIGSTTAPTVALDVTGAIAGSTTVKTGGYTVATLPAGTVGMRAYVTDATAPTYNATLVGGGAVTVPVFYNGAAWVSA